MVVASRILPELAGEELLLSMHLRVESMMAQWILIPPQVAFQFLEGSFSGVAEWGLCWRRLDKI